MLVRTVSLLFLPPSVVYHRVSLTACYTVRVAAKEITSLILDEERLRAERSDRKSWKSRVTGLEEQMPHQQGEPSARRPPRERRPGATEEEDAEYRLALEASKYQEEEDRRMRETRQGPPGDDDDLAKAIKLSKEEDERRRRELEESNAASLFDDSPSQTQPTQPQPTGFNNGYQQGNQVDWYANQIDANQVQNQQTGYLPNAYTGYQQAQLQQQPTQPPQNFANNYTGFGTQPTGADPYGQQNTPLFQSQPTGYNPYIQQQQMGQPQIQSPSDGSPINAGSHNPWATNQQQQQQSLKPTPTGSNNPFASFNNRPSSAKPTMNSLGALPEQKTLSTFNPPPFQSQNSFPIASPSSNVPQRDLNEHETKLNSLLATGDGMDTFGNTGNLRLPAQHTAPGTFVNSAGSGVARINAEATGNNPFLRQQYTGMPTVNYGQTSHVTGPAGMNGQLNNNPFAGQQQQHHTHNNDLIQF